MKSFNQIILALGIIFTLFGSNTHCMWQSIRSRATQAVRALRMGTHNVQRTAVKNTPYFTPKITSLPKFSVRLGAIAGAGLTTATMGTIYAEGNIKAFNKKDLQENILNSWSRGFEAQRAEYIDLAIQHITTQDPTEIEAIRYVLNAYKKDAAQKLMPAINKDFDNIHPSILKEILIYYPDATQDYMTYLIEKGGSHFEHIFKNYTSRKKQNFWTLCFPMNSCINEYPEHNKNYDWIYTNAQDQQIQFADELIDRILQNPQTLPVHTFNTLFRLTYGATTPQKAKQLILDQDRSNIKNLCSLIKNNSDIATGLTPYTSCQLHRINPEILQTILQHNPNAASEFVKYFAVAHCNEATRKIQETMIIHLLDTYLAKKTSLEQPIGSQHKNFDWRFTTNNKATSFDEYVFETFLKNPKLISYNFHSLIIQHCTKTHPEIGKCFSDVARASYNVNNPLDGTIERYNPTIHQQKLFKTAINGRFGTWNIGSYHDIYVIFSKSDIAGYVILNKNTNYIEILFVDSTKRRSRYGQKLMEQAIRHFRQKETKKEFNNISLTSVSDRAPQSLYEKLGFTSPNKRHYTLS